MMKSHEIVIRDLSNLKQKSPRKIQTHVFSVKAPTPPTAGKSPSLGKLLDVPKGRYDPQFQAVANVNSVIDRSS